VKLEELKHVADDFCWKYCEMEATEEKVYNGLLDSIKNVKVLLNVK